MISANEGFQPPELYEVVSAAFNHEVKTLTLAAMIPRVPYTMAPIRSRVMSLQGSSPAWDLGRNAAHDFCANFIANGLATTERVGNRDALAYTITDRGRTVAIPIAGHFMELSLDNEQSLSAFFGPTHAHGESGIRPSEHRIKVMDVLQQLGGEAISSSDLAELLETSSSLIGRIGDELEATGIVSKKSMGKGKASVTFTAEPGFEDIELRTDWTSQLLFDVVDFLKTYFAASPDAKINNHDIARGLIASGRSSEPLPKLAYAVHHRTDYLASIRGALQAHREIPTKRAREIMWATAEQRDRLSNIMSIINGMANPSEEYLKSGQEMVQTIITDPDMVNTLVAKARRDSFGLKSPKQEQRQMQVLIEEILLCSDTPLSVREVRAKLLETDTNLGHQTVRRHLSILTEAGTLAISESPEGQKFSKTNETNT